MVKMQNKAKAIFAFLFALLLIFSFTQFPTSRSEPTTFEEQALTYINNVLPLDMTQYNVTSISVNWLPPGYQDTRVWNTTSVYLSGPNSTINVGFIFVNGIMRQCRISYMSGTPLMEPGYGGMSQVAAEVLARHDAVVGVDSSQLIAALNGQSSSASLKVSSTPMYNMKTVNGELVRTDYLGETTFYIWTLSVDGVGYNTVVLTFENGRLCDIQDDRSCYPIGGTEVNITKEQAFDLAKEHINNYTNNFNLTVTKQAATLGSFARNYSQLYPCWMVTLRFDLNVDDVSVYVWADTGDVFWCYQGGSPLNQSELKLISTTKFSIPLDVPTPTPTPKPSSPPPETPPTDTPTPQPTLLGINQQASSQASVLQVNSQAQDTNWLNQAALIVVLAAAVFASVLVVNRKLKGKTVVA